MGKYLGPYQVEAELGRGAMGVVFQVRRGGGGPPLALKLLLPHVLEDEVGVDRFLREAHAMRDLGDHPGIVAVIDYGKTAQGMPYYVMEFVPGRTLRQAARDLSERPRLELIQQIARALEHAHEQGFVHRDVKPDNVMVTEDGRALLTDFGIARVLGGNQALTRTGDILGTPVYMAPELATPGMGEAGPPVDVFSLGAMIYEVLTGRTPYTGKTAVGIFTKLLEGHDIPSLRSQRPTVSPDLEAIVERALQRQPADRYADAGALADDLEVALASGPIDVAPRNATALIGALIGVLVVVAFALTAWRVLSRTDPPPPPSSAQAKLLEEGKVLKLLEELSVAEAWSAQGLELIAPEDRARLAAWAGAPASALEAALEAVESEPRRRALWWELRRFAGWAPPAESALTSALGAGWVGIAQGEEALGRGLAGIAAVCFERVAAEETEAALLLAARLGLARAHLALGDLPAADAALAAARDAGHQAPGPDLARVRWQMVARRVLRGVKSDAQKGWTGAADRDLALPEPPTQVARFRAELRGTQSYDMSSARELADCARGLDGAEGLLLAHASRLATASEAGNHGPSARAAVSLLETVTRLRPDSPAAWIALARARLVLHQPREANTCIQKATQLSPFDPETRFAAADVRAGMNAYAKDTDLDKLSSTTYLNRTSGLLGKAVRRYQSLYPKVSPALSRAARVRAARKLLERARLEALIASNESRNRQGLARVEAQAKLRDKLFEELRPLLEARGRKVDVTGIQGQRAQLLHKLRFGDRSDQESRFEAIAKASADLSVEQVEALRIMAGAGDDQWAKRYAAAYMSVAGDLPAHGLLRVRRLELDPRSGVAKRSLRRWVAIDRSLMLPYVRLRAEELLGGRGRSPASLQALARVVLDGPELTLHVLALLAKEGGVRVPEPAADDPHRPLMRALASRAAALDLPGLDPPKVTPEQARRALLDAQEAVDAHGDRSGVYLVRALIRLNAAPNAAPARARALQDLAVARAGAPWAWPVLRALHRLQPSDGLTEELLGWGLLDLEGLDGADQVQKILETRDMTKADALLREVTAPTLRLTLHNYVAFFRNSLLEDPSKKLLAGVPPGPRALGMITPTRYRDRARAGQDGRLKMVAKARLVSLGLKGLNHSAPIGQARRLTRADLLAPGTMPTDAAERRRTGAPSHPTLWTSAYRIRRGPTAIAEVGQGVTKYLEPIYHPPSLFDGWTHSSALLHGAQEPEAAWAWRWLGASRDPAELERGATFDRYERLQEGLLALERDVAFSRGEPVEVSYFRAFQGLRAAPFNTGDRIRLEVAHIYLNFVRSTVGRSSLLDRVDLDMSLDALGRLLEQNEVDRCKQMLPKVRGLLQRLPEIRDVDVDPPLYQSWRRFRAHVVLGERAEAAALLKEMAPRLGGSPYQAFGRAFGRYVAGDKLNRPQILPMFPNLGNWLNPRRR